MSTPTKDEQTAPVSRQHPFTQQLTQGHEWAYTPPNPTAPPPPAPAPAPAKEPLIPAAKQDQNRKKPGKRPKNRWQLTKGAVLGSAAAVLLIGLSSGAAIGWAMGSAAATPAGFGDMQQGELPDNSEFGGPPQGGQEMNGEPGEQGQTEQGNSAEQGGSSGSNSNYDSTLEQELSSMGS